jgi:serine O-acetyltransferase
MRILKLLIGVPIGIDISFDAVIGKGFYVGHYGGIIIGEGVMIGENCNISQGVTIGVGGRNEKRGSPKIGDRVYIAPGAKIFGEITIGDDCAIGANAVVATDVPDRAVLGGVPAKIINYNSSKDFIHLTS